MVVAIVQLLFAHTAVVTASAVGSSSEFSEYSSKRACTKRSQSFRISLSSLACHRIARPESLVVAKRSIQRSSSSLSSARAIIRTDRIKSSHSLPLIPRNMRVRASGRVSPPPMEPEVNGLVLNLYKSSDGILRRTVISLGHSSEVYGGVRVLP